MKRFGVGLCAVLCVWLVLFAQTSRLVSSPEQGSASYQGLRLSISEIVQSDQSQPAFEVTFRNVGERDTTLNLGLMLANGRVQFPSEVRLHLTDDKGKTRELAIHSPFVRGRIDDYIVPLRVGSTCSVRLQLNDFWPLLATKESKLASGRYTVSAEFTGKGAKYLNLDTKGLKLMNFWKGKVRSNILTFER